MWGPLARKCMSQPFSQVCVARGREREGGGHGPKVAAVRPLQSLPLPFWLNLTVAGAFTLRMVTRS